jgi:uncharacterized protein
MAQQQRYTAHKIWLSELDNAPFHKSSKEFEPSFFEIKGQKISRINTIATVTNKNINEGFASITIDDSSSQIRAKVWQEDTKKLESINISDTALVIGKIREYNEEKYIVPEVIKKVSPNWEIAHKLNLLKERGKPEISTDTVEVKEEEIKTNNSNPSLRQSVLTTIDTSGDAGIEIEILCQNLNQQEQEVMPIIEELLREGQVFEALPGKYKVLK